MDEDVAYDDGEDKSVQMLSTDSSEGPNNSQIDKIFSKRRSKLVKNSDEPATAKSDESVVRQTRQGGRKKKQPKRYIDPSVKLNTIQLDHLATSTDRRVDLDQEIFCGVCSENFTDRAKANYHILAVHNGVARINSKEPFTVSEENNALRMCLKRLKRLQCPREDCQKNLTTLLGYKSHLQTCGSMEKTKCPKCFASLKPNSLYSHMRSFHENQKEKEDDEVSLDDSNNKRKESSRKAAIRARKTVKLKNLTEDKSCGDTEIVDHEDWMFEQFVGKNDSLTSISTEQYEVWKAEYETNGVIQCATPNCMKSFKTISGMKYHFQRCGKNLEYSCQKCDFTTSSKTAIKKHILEHFESLSQVSKDQEELLLKIKASSSSTKQNRMKMCPYVTFLNTFFDTYKLSHLNMKNMLFDYWFPSMDLWNPLPESDSQQYLSQYKNSAKFKCRSRRKGSKNATSNGMTNSYADQDEWMSLPLFETYKEDYIATMYVGGTVHSIAWCPTPTGLSMDNMHEQYLAVAADTSFYDIREPRVYHSKSGSSAIQIWSLGVLGKEGLKCVPKHSFSLALDFGQVKCMDWCSSGCYNVYDSERESLRIGLLAVGCSDGNAYIYSIPKLEFESNSHLVFKPPPVVKLQPPRCNLITCMCISWFSSGERNKIIAGFGNGLVCVWNLTTKSQLLWLEDNTETSTLSPYVTFMPHTGPITCVSWCPNTDGYHFATGSSDKEVKIWAMSDLCQPLMNVKKTIVTDCYWSPLACGIFCCHDDSFQFRQNRSYYYECGYYGHSARCLAYHNASVTKMTFSEWLNTMVTCDYGGEIIAVILYQYQEMFRKKKNHRLYKIAPICNCTVEDLVGECDVSADQNELNFELMLSTYEEVIQKKGVIFNDSPVEQLDLLPEKDVSRVGSMDSMNPEPFHHYNLQTVTSVAWNPNCGAYFWLASGYNSGFVRLHCIKGLENPATNNLDFTHLSQQSASLNSSNNHPQSEPDTSTPLKGSNPKLFNLLSEKITPNQELEKNEDEFIVVKCEPMDDDDADVSMQ